MPRHSPPEALLLAPPTPSLWRVIGTQPFAGRARAQTFVVVTVAPSREDAIRQAQAHLHGPWAETWTADRLEGPLTLSIHATPRPLGDLEALLVHAECRRALMALTEERLGSAPPQLHAILDRAIAALEAIDG